MSARAIPTRSAVPSAMNRSAMAGESSRPVPTTGSDTQSLIPRGRCAERTWGVVVRGPVRAAAPRARHDALPHVEVVDLAVRFEPARDLAVVVQPQAPLLEIVVHADTEDALAPERVAHRVHRLVQERHPLLERRAAVSVLPAVRLRVQEIGEEVVPCLRKARPRPGRPPSLGALRPRTVRASPRFPRWSSRGERAGGRRNRAPAPPTAPSTAARETPPRPRPAARDARAGQGAAPRIDGSPPPSAGTSARCGRRSSRARAPPRRRSTARCAPSPRCPHRPSPAHRRSPRSAG